MLLVICFLEYLFVFFVVLLEVFFRIWDGCCFVLFRFKVSEEFVLF